MAGLYPSFEDFLRQAGANSPSPQQPAPGMIPPAPTGTGGMVMSALGGGGREALSQLGSAVQAGAKFVGANDFAAKAEEFARGQQALAAQNENPAWEGTSPWSPSGLAYRVLKGLPAAGGILAGALAAPEVLGGGALTGALAAGALGYPLAVGGNVQTSEAVRGPLSQGEAGRALAYGVPEAAIGAWPMGRLEGMFARGAQGGVVRAATGQAGVQAIAGAGQDFVAQQMGDPNRPIAQRAQEMVESALTGGATGALFGAGIHALSKKAPASVTPKDLGDAIDQAVKPQVAGLLPAPAPQEPAAINMGAERPYGGLSNEELLSHRQALASRGDQAGLAAVASEMQSRVPPGQPSNPDDPMNAAWAQQAGGLPVRDFDRTMEGSEAERLAGAWASTPQHAGQALLPSPATRLGGEISPRSPAELIATAKELELKGDTEGLLGVVREMKLRGMLDKVTGTPLLPPPDAIRTPQQPLEPAHEPTLATVPKRDIAGEPVFDRKGNPLSTRAPVELGHTITGEPEPSPKLLNSPPPEPTPTGEMGQNQPYAGEVLKMPDRSAPAPETVRQMTAEAAQEAGVKKLPKTFQQALTLEDMQAAIRAKWEEGGPNKLVRKLAGKFDMLDENGDLKPAAKAAPEAPKAEPVKPVENPIRAAVEPKHQERFDKLEALRANVPADQQATIDKAQETLTSPGVGVPQQVEATIRMMNEVAKGHKAASKLAERNALVEQGNAEQEALMRRVKAIQDGTVPIDEVIASLHDKAPAAPVEEPKASPAALAKVNEVIARMNAVKDNPSEKPGTRPGDQGVMKGTYGETEQGRAAVIQLSKDYAEQHPDRRGGAQVIGEGDRRASAIKLAQEWAAEAKAANVSTDRFDPARAAATAAQQSLDALKAVNPVPSEKEALATGHTNAESSVKNLWKKELADRQAKLDALKDRLKWGGKPESLIGTPMSHFRSQVWDEKSMGAHGARFSTEAELALMRHGEAEQEIIKALSLGKAPPMEHGDLFAKHAAPGDIAPRTQSDVDLTGIVRAGGKAQDVLDHLATNGSTPQNRVLAMDLAKRGLGSKVEFGDQAGTDKFRNLGAGEQAAAAYDPKGDRIRLFNGANLEQSVLHEAVHAASHVALDAGGPAAREFKALWNETLTRLQGGAADTVTQEQGQHVLAGIENPHEFLAEGMTNDHFKDWLRSQPAVEGKATLWQKFKAAVAKLMGYEGGKKTLLDQLMERGAKVMDEQADMRAIDAEAASAKAWGYHGSKNSPEAIEQHARPMFDRVKEFGDRVTQTFQDEADGNRALNVSSSVRKAALGWQTGNHIAAWYGKYSKGLADFVGHQDRRDLLNEVNNKAARAAVSQLRSVPAPEMKVLDGMAHGTHVGLDGRKPWSAHKDLFDKANARDLMAEHQKLYRAWGKLSPETQAAYNSAISANRSVIHQLYATSLYNLIKGDYAGKIPLPEGWDPTEQHRFAADLHDDPAKNEKFWKDTYDQLSRLAQNHVNAVDGEAVKYRVTRDTLPPNVEKFKALSKKLDDSTAPLRSLLGDAAARNIEMDRTPNFRMGHGDGGYFVAGKLALGDDGLAPAASVAKFQKALNDAGFGHVSLDRNLENPSVYARVDSPADMARLAEVFKGMQGSGVLDGGVSNGAIGEVLTRGGILPQWQERALEVMRSQLRDLGGDADEGTRAAVEQRVADAQREFMAMLPDSSVNKIMARRAGVQGFREDMLDSFKQRASASSRMLANIATMPNIAEAIVRMRKDVQDTNNNPNATDAQKLAVHHAAQELMVREAQRTMAQPGNFIKAARELTHVMEIGTSPAYVLTLLSQIGTLTLPRLGASEGYLRSAQALGRATKMTFKVLNAVAHGPEGLSFGVREKELLAAGVPKNVADFLTHISAMGSFTHGAYTTAMRGEHFDAQGFGKVRNWASVMGLYAEMMPRVLTALAAKDLYEGRPNNRSGDVHDFAHDMVVRSQLPWNPSFNPRQVTKGGTFGSMSPLVNQFMGYQIRVSELLYREAANAIVAREGPKAQAEARKFLLGHLAAITTIAGTLGMPMAAVAASVYDRLADWVTNTDDHDITASYRNFLSHTFGRGVGEAVARGVPRAFGLDLSHLGDQKLLPGSTTAMVLTEKRKMEDAEKDWLKSEAGSAAGLFANFAFGARDIANGDYLRGAQKLVPELLRGPVEAVQLAKRGYVDKNGVKLPITAKAHDVLMTAMGLDPAQEAEYREGKRTLTGLTSMAETRQQNITQHLSQALNRGDTQDFGYWTGQSQQYQANHPGMLPPLADLGRFMQQHYRSSAFANAVGGPLGLRPRDLAGRGMVGYMNLPER